MDDFSVGQRQCAGCNLTPPETAVVDKPAEADEHDHHHGHAH